MSVEVRRGIAAIAIAVVVILLIAAAAGAYFYYATSGTAGSSDSRTTCSTALTIPLGSTTTTALPCVSAGAVGTGSQGGSSSSSQSSSQTSSQSSSQTSTQSSSSVTTGTSSSTLTFTLPSSTQSSSPSTRTSASTSSTSPFGVYNVTFAYVQNSSASGSTTTIQGSGKFTVDVSKGSAVVIGEGTIAYSITGLCKGSQAVNYTYTVVGAVDTQSHNLTLAFEAPNPQSSVVQIVCSGQQGTASYSWTAAVPVIVSIHAAHGANAHGETSNGEVDWYFNID